VLVLRLRAWRGYPAVALALCVSLFVSSCATYAPRPGPPGAVLARERSPAVRLALRDGRTIEMFEPALRVDSASSAAAARPDTVVAGFVFDARLGRRTPAAVPLRDVVVVSGRVPDRAANHALIVGTTAVFAVAFAIVMAFFVECGRRHPTCLD
jgi:hypothetical protein